MFESKFNYQNSCCYFFLFFVNRTENKHFGKSISTEPNSKPDECVKYFKHTRKKERENENEKTKRVSYP